MILSISIDNFKKYNPRSDQKTSSWFRLENNFLLDPIIQELNAVETFVYIYCLGQISSKKGESAKINSKFASIICKCTESEFLAAISSLEEHGCIRTGSQKDGSQVNEETDVTPPPEPVTQAGHKRDTSVTPTCPTNERYERNDTNVTNSGAPEESNFSNSQIQKPPSPEELIELWNSLAPPHLKYKPFSIGGGKHRKAYENSLGFSEMRSIEKWREVFEIATKPSWWRDKGTLCFTWMLEYDNVLDVLAGKYNKNFAQGDNESEGTDWSFMSQEAGNG